MIPLTTALRQLQQRLLAGRRRNLLDLPKGQHAGVQCRNCGWSHFPRLGLLRPAMPRQCPRCGQANLKMVLVCVD